MIEWILLAQQVSQEIGDNSIAAMILGTFATIITSLLKFAPTLEHARLRGRSDDDLPHVIHATPPNVDERLRSVEAHLVRVETNQSNTAQQVTQLASDLRELFTELRKQKPPSS